MLKKRQRLLYANNFGGAGDYVAEAWDFDGTNDYATRGANLTGIVDGKEGTFSGWVRLDGGDGSYQILLALRNAAGAAYFQVLRGDAALSNQFVVNGSNSGGGAILQLETVRSYTASGVWLHLLASWNLATGATHLYINDISDKDTVAATNAAIDYANGNVGIGALTDGTLKLNGAMAEMWFTTTYIDFSVESNRRKFISAAGKPVNLGSDGSFPTGSAPLLYTRNFATNLGSGGNFTVTGALDAASTTPSNYGIVAYDPILPAQFSDNGYSADEGNYFQSSSMARLVVSTDAAFAKVRWYVDPDLYTTAVGLGYVEGISVGVWDGTTKQTLQATGGGVNTHTVTLAAGTKTVEVITGATTRTNGVGTVDGSYPVAATFYANTFATHAPPAVANRLVVYGDSIAAGANAVGPTNVSWIAKLRALRGTDSTMLEAWGYRSLDEDYVGAEATAALAARIASYSPSIVWLAIGTNDYGLENWPADSFEIGYADLLDRLHAALPSAAIYAQSPILRSAADEAAANAFGDFPSDYRTAVSNACVGRAWATFVDGTTFINPATQLDDDVHPNDAGHTAIYEAVATALGLTP